MAVIMKMDAIDFFKKADTFGVLDSAFLSAKAAALESVGVKFTIELYCIRASKESAVWALNLPVSTSTFMKAGALDAELVASVKMVSSFLENLLGLISPKAAVAEKVVLTGFDNAVTLAPQKKKPAKKDPAKADYSAVAPSTVKVKPIDFDGAPTPNPATIVPLIEASILGQKVRGTSAGSIYRLVAANDRVKVAARLSGDSLSLRVEVSNPSQAEIKKITASGIEWKAGYGSMHVSLGIVPASRVLGAVLYGMGVPFDVVIPVGKEADLAGV